MARHANPTWRTVSRTYRVADATLSGPIRGLARLRKKGLEHVPASGGALVVCNHLSIADPILVNAAIPRPTHWLAKAELFSTPTGRFTMGALGCIEVDRAVGRNEGAVDAAVRAIREGKLVGVFPEGTRSRPGEVRPGRTGAARIAALSGAPLVPVGVDTSDFWPRHARVPRLGAKVYMAFGAPLDLRLAPADADDKDRMRDATADIMSRVRELVATAQAAKEENARW